MVYSGYKVKKWYLILLFPAFFSLYFSPYVLRIKKKKKNEIAQENSRIFVFFIPPQKKIILEHSSEHASCNVLVLPLHYRILFLHPVASRPAKKKKYLKK